MNEVMCYTVGHKKVIQYSERMQILLNGEGVRVEIQRKGCKRCGAIGKWEDVK